MQELAPAAKIIRRITVFTAFIQKRIGGNNEFINLQKFCQPADIKRDKKGAVLVSGSF